MNYKKIISQNLNFISDDITHHDCERLIRKIFTNRFLSETGFYLDFSASKDYESQKKLKLQKIEEAGITLDIIKRYNQLDGCLKYHIHYDVDDKFLLIQNADQILEHYTYDESGIRGHNILMDYFKKHGINIDDLKVFRKVIKVKKSTKSYAKLKNLLYLHNDLIRKMKDYYYNI